MPMGYGQKCDVCGEPITLLVRNGCHDNMSVCLFNMSRRISELERRLEKYEGSTEHATQEQSGSRDSEDGGSSRS